MRQAMRRLAVDRRRFLAAGLAWLGVAGCNVAGNARPIPRAPARPIVPPSPPPDGEPIVFGGAVSLTGVNAAIGKYMLNAFELGVAHLNQSGGLLGRPARLLAYDDNSDPKTAARLYKRLIERDKVQLLLGPYSSAVNAEVAPVAEAGQMALLATGSDTAIFTRGYRFVFQANTAADQYLTGALYVAKRLGCATVAMVNEDSAFPNAVQSAVEQQAPTLGLRIVFREKYPRGHADFRDLLRRAAEQRPDALLGGTYLPDSQAIATQSREIGFTPRFIAMTVGPAVSEFASIGAAADGIFGSVNWAPELKTAGNAEFVAAFAKAYNRQPAYYAAMAYMLIQVMAEGARRAKVIDQGRLADEIRRLTLDTVYGRFRVDQQGVQTGFRAYLAQWQSGHQTLVWPDEQATGLPIAPRV